MGSYIFMASDSPFKTLFNPKVQLYTYEEAERLGLKHNMVGLTLEQREERWQNIREPFAEYKGKVEYYENLEDKHELVVYPVEYPGTAYGAQGFVSVTEFTDKKHIADFSYKYTPERMKQLLNYITNHIWTAGNVELWRIWVGDDMEQFPIEYTQCEVDRLTPSHILNFKQQRWQPSEFRPCDKMFVPGCLTIVP